VLKVRDAGEQRSCHFHNLEYIRELLMQGITFAPTGKPFGSRVYERDAAL
jgi:hypothetical protein